MGRKPGDGTRHVDGFRFGFFLDVGVLARTLRGRAGWKLLQGFREDSSRVSLPAYLAAGFRRRRSAVLLFLACGRNLGTGGHSYSAAIHPSSCWHYCSTGAPARYAAPVPHVALPDSRDIGNL